MVLIFNRLVLFFVLSLFVGFSVSRLFFFQATMQDMSRTEIKALFAESLPKSKIDISEEAEELKRFYEKGAWEELRNAAEQGFSQLTSRGLLPQEVCRALPQGICFYYWGARIQIELSANRQNMAEIFLDYMSSDPVDQEELYAVMETILPEDKFPETGDSTQSLDEKVFASLMQGDLKKLPVKSGLHNLVKKQKFFYYIELGLCLFCTMLFAFYIYPVQKARSAGGLDADDSLVVRCMGISRNGLFFLWLAVLLLMANQLFFEAANGKELDFSYKLIIYISYTCFGLLATLFWQNLSMGPQAQIARELLHKEALYQPKDSKNSLSLNFRLLLTTMTMTLIPLFFLFVLVVTEPTTHDFIKAAFSNQLSSVFVFDLVPIVKFFIALFFVIFFIFTGFFAGRSLEKCFTKPLESLLDKMQKVRQGNFSVRTSVANNDEIGRLKADFNAMVSTLDEAKGLQDAMDKYLSKEISRTVMDDATLGGVDLDATVLFSDIRGFTSLSEKLSPKEVIDFLNDYFSHVVTAIIKEGGVINKYIGDCVMALFGVTTQTPLHADQALAAALAMREKVRIYNILRERAGEVPVRIGIGIHSGPLVAGNMGTPDRLEYTVIGDTVNVASRIESQTKELQTDILISKELKDRLSGKQKVKFVRCPGIMVKGKSEPLELYKVLPLTEEKETAQDDSMEPDPAQSEDELPAIPDFD